MFSSRFVKNIQRTAGRRAYLPTLIAFLAIVSFSIYTERQAAIINDQEARAHVRTGSSLLRSRLEGYVNADLHLIQGLVAAISGNLTMSQQEYSSLASRVVGAKKEFINIGIAPDLVITLVHPLERNRAAIGLDYTKNDAQREAAFLVRDSGKMVLAGPLDLVQGGRGFVARYPVWEDRIAGRRFWGLVAAVIDADILFEEVGLTGDDLSLDVALVGKDAKGADGALFFGNPEILDDTPVLMDISLPVGTWQLAARPKGGWDATPSNTWSARLFFVVAGFLILVPTFAAGRLSDMRRGVIDKLQRRDAELEKLSLVAKHASDSIVLSTPTGIINWVNPGFTRMTGYSFEEAVGQSIGDLLDHPDTDPETVAAIRDASKTPKALHKEILNVTKDGRAIWVDTNIVPVLDDAGQVTMLISIEREITDAKNSRQELAEAKMAAEKADRAKSDFLANMSHEIRTPMNGIVGMAELLSESPLPSDDQQCVDIIRDSSHALLKIINDILDLSRLESGKLEVSNVDFDLRNCIDGAVDILRHKAVEKNISLDVTFAPDLPKILHSDDGRLRQILVNLIGNAVKFTAQGRVTVAVKRLPSDPYRISVVVTDTGIGISDEQARRIFDRFAQADAATTRAFGGAGLGLTISSMLAERMGGEIKLCKATTSGACFDVTIQGAAPIGSLQPKSPQYLYSVDHLEGARILLAEDNKTNRLLIRKYLSGLPVRLIEVENGLEAVEACQHQRPDVVLMDMSMPELDGIGATKAIRQLNIVQPPIIALTANAFASDKQACLDAGMDYFLSKPINKNKLVQALATHLERRAAS